MLKMIHAAAYQTKAPEKTGQDLPLLLHLYKSKLRHQNVLEKKDALEAQEEQTRRQKERLQLEADIAASMEKNECFQDLRIINAERCSTRIGRHVILFQKFRQKLKL